MIIVGNTIVSDDIADCRFSCDLACCRGACCIEGDSGAPLREEEVAILEALLPEVEPYMTPEGIAAVREQGVAVRDKDGDLGTPLISGNACAYITYDDDCGEPIADGFYFTFCYPGFTGADLVEEMLYYGVSGISLDTCGSTKQGIRACTSLIQREEIPILAERLKAFALDHPVK